MLLLECRSEAKIDSVASMRCILQLKQNDNCIYSGVIRSHPESNEVPLNISYVDLKLD